MYNFIIKVRESPKDSESELAVGTWERADHTTTLSTSMWLIGWQESSRVDLTPETLSSRRLRN
ncbi:unnamed protein product [Candida parapsilosis]